MPKGEQTYEEYKQMKSHGRETSNPMIRRRVGAMTMINPAMDAEKMMGINKPDSAQDKVAMITRTETQIGTTKHGHPIIHLNRED